jgi:GxxExxY protein
MTQIRRRAQNGCVGDRSAYPHASLTDRIIKVFYEVYNHLGSGFLEKLYEKAMIIELEEAGLRVETQVSVAVSYKGRVIVDYALDLVVEDTVVLELKAVRIPTEEHAAQLMNYLRATKYEIGLLLNFGTKPKVRRFLYTREYKS